MDDTRPLDNRVRILSVLFVRRAVRIPHNLKTPYRDPIINQNMILNMNIYLKKTTTTYFVFFVELFVEDEMALKFTSMMRALEWSATFSATIVRFCSVTGQLAYL